MNAAFARKYWPNHEALGQTFEVARPEYGLVEVVGIVEDVRTRGPALPAPPTFFVPFHGQPRNNMGLFVRVSGAPVDFVDAVRAAVWAVDSSQPIDRIQTMTSLVEDALALPRLAQSLLGRLASIGLGLAILGLFAVVSYSVRIRRAELGIRLAFGATPLRLQRELVSQVAPLIAFGRGVGSVLGVLSGYAARSLLHGVSPGDPVSIVVAVVVVATAALTAAYLPVRTVATIEPALSIRET